MELAVGTNLILPLFIYDDSLSNRDTEHPDFSMSIELTQNMLDELCQNPDEDTSLCIYLDKYELIEVTEPYKSILKSEHMAQLQINKGPCISLLLNLADGTSFVSPQMDFMPTFDLGIDEDLENDEQDG